MNEFSEKSIETYLRKKVEAFGGKCRKWKSPQNAGVLDRIVQVFGQVWFVELKRPDGELSKLQEKEIKWLSDNGYKFEVIASIKEVDAFMLRVLGEALDKTS